MKTNSIASKYWKVKLKQKPMKKLKDEIRKKNKKKIKEKQR
jgi:hypothetical protein